MTEEKGTSKTGRKGSGRLTSESPTDYLTREYLDWQRLFGAQPALIQRFIEAQTGPLADAYVEGTQQIRFTLPDRVVTATHSEGEGAAHTASVPADMREQLAGGLMDRLTRTHPGVVLRQRLDELEASSNRGVSVSAGLTRYATALHMVHAMLPSGRTVTYRAAEDEEIPTIPVVDEMEPESAITAATDAIVEEGQDTGQEGRGELIVPYVPAARHFYLPQWVAFDNKGQLLVNSTGEAEAHVASMQRFLKILHGAVALGPYMVADKEYQQKRYGMLGQLVNQGRALARYEAEEIIRIIQRRAEANDLNRGLSLSLPYFDDQDLEMKMHDFVVIPGGRIMFVPAFVVRAARQEQVKVAQDTRLSPSTRKHLLNELKTLERAFESSTND